MHWLLIRANSYAPANQNHWFLIQNSIQTAPIESLRDSQISLWNFTSQTSITCTSLHIIFQDPSQNSPLMSGHSKGFPYQVPNTSIILWKYGQAYPSHSPLSGGLFCPSWLSTAIITNITKNNLEWKWLISYYSLPSILKEHVWRNLGEETTAESTENHCLLVCPPRVTQVYSPGPPAHSGLNLPVTSINVEKCPTDFPTGLQ